MGMTAQGEIPVSKKKRLEEILRDMGSVAVAYSSGVDSTYLLYMAAHVLGERAAAITAFSPLFSSGEQKESEEFCRTHGIRHITIPFQPLELPAFRENPKDRCYHCKTVLFREIRRLAKENGYAVVAEGTNLDDLTDYRPGLAAIEELGIRSPLKEAGLTKADIRALSREAGLPTWNRPSFACLASRFVYGEAITEERLIMVGKAEEYLKELGLRQFRVRIHDTLARIEVEPQEIGRLAALPVREELSRRFRELGFRYVTLDLQGYQTGSMNRVLEEDTGGEEAPSFPTG